ncbi:MAG: DUF1566 domain-containing protein [Candidatus Electrothrix sp. GW3-4]|uniref:Lcl C-terminal domain-containing protein n=1 Tax=Candidatus Electrothrix sp. GW3-4 TaxID=3126740 RepID=UPI0030D5C124
MHRFALANETVIDRQTGLMWTQDASLFDFSATWSEALARIQEINRRERYGYRDWRLPNRKELFSLMSHNTINPSLPTGHPFTNVFTGYYWTSSTCARLPNQAWYIHLGGARVFKGMKYDSYMVWPVRTGEGEKKSRLFCTGQKDCFDENGSIIDCHTTGQDGEIQAGLTFSKDRFAANKQAVRDKDTGLIWLRNANVLKTTMDWNSAFSFIAAMNSETAYGYNDWRVPNIIELESLTDLSQHSSALPEDHLFNDVQEFYWSSSTSMYDKSYAWVLYMVDGAVGVGYKPLSGFYLWPVRGKEKRMLFIPRHDASSSKPLSRKAA